MDARRHRFLAVFIAFPVRSISVAAMFAFAIVCGHAGAEMQMSDNVEKADGLKQPARQGAIERSLSAVPKEDIVPPAKLLPLRADFLPKGPLPACGAGKRLALAGRQWTCVNATSPAPGIPRSRFGGASRVWVLPNDNIVEGTIYSAVAAGATGGEINFFNWDRAGVLLLDDDSAGRFVIGRGERLFLGGLGGRYYGWKVVVSDTPIVIWGNTYRNTRASRYATAHSRYAPAIPVECSEPGEYAAFEMACMFYERETARD